MMDELGLKEGEYIVFTLNRKALIQDKENLKRMVRAMADSCKGGTHIVAVLRDSARKVVDSLIPAGAGIVQAAPLPYLQFGWLTAHAKGIITDSGNVAEEATFNGVPCITLNSYTEHIETAGRKQPCPNAGTAAPPSASCASSWNNERFL